MKNCLRLARQSLADCYRWKLPVALLLAMGASPVQADLLQPVCGVDNAGAGGLFAPGDLYTNNEHLSMVFKTNEAVTIEALEFSGVNATDFVTLSNSILRARLVEAVPDSGTDYKPGTTVYADLGNFGTDNASDLHQFSNLDAQIPANTVFLLSLTMEDATSGMSIFGADGACLCGSSSAQTNCGYDEDDPIQLGVQYLNDQGTGLRSSLNWWWPNTSKGRSNAVFPDLKMTFSTNSAALSVVDTDGDGIGDETDIDSDGDGITNLIEGACETSIASSDRRYADSVLYYTDPSNIPDRADNPEAALGAPDYDDDTSDTIEQFVALGSTGSVLILGFNDNVMTNSGDSRIDFVEHEVGEAEAAAIYARPLAATKTLLETNGYTLDAEGYVYLGSLNGSSSSLDFDATFSGQFAAGTLMFDAVKLLATENAGGDFAGPDIDAVEALFSICNPPDSDGDGITDMLDLDSDNDGIPDNIEAQATATYTAPTGTDTDADGMDDAYDVDNGGTSLTPVDTDGATTDGYGAQSLADYLDTDADNDGASDTDESGLTLSGNDSNGDGIDDAVNASYADVNGDINAPLTDLRNVDASLDLENEPDYRDTVLQQGPPDTDGDGIADAVDLDDDNDGIPDTLEMSCKTGVDTVANPVSGGSSRNWTASGDLTIDGVVLPFSFTATTDHTSLFSTDFSNGFHWHSYHYGTSYTQQYTYAVPANNLQSLKVLWAPQVRTNNTRYFENTLNRTYKATLALPDGVTATLLDPTGNATSLADQTVLTNGSDFDVSSIDWRVVFDLTGYTGSFEFGVTITPLTGTGVTHTAFGTNLQSCTDLDSNNDAIPNRLSTDSDGDACYDAQEGGTATTTTVAGPYGSNGLADSLEKTADSGELLAYPKVLQVVNSTMKTACTTSTTTTTTTTEQTTTTEPTTSTTPTEVCNDGIDNDLDGLIDSFDPDCQVCTDLPPPSPIEFAMQTEWKSTLNTIHNSNAPVLGDLEGDGIVDILVSDNTGVIYRFNGDGSNQSAPDALISTAMLYQSPYAIADIDRDGDAEIGVIGKDQHIYLFAHTGGDTTSNYLLKSDMTTEYLAGGVRFSDIDEDGTPEIIAGMDIYKIDLQAQTLKRVIHLRHPYMDITGGVNGFQNSAVPIDILSDDQCAACHGKELVTGERVYAVDIPAGMIYPVRDVRTVRPNYSNGSSSTKTAIADINLDGKLDVVASGLIWTPEDNTLVMDSAWIRGNPTIGNVIDDVAMGLGTVDYPEIIYTDMSTIKVYNMNVGGLLDSKGSPDVSGSTTSTLFDFNGDGLDEIINRGDSQLIMWGASTGTLTNLANYNTTSGTWYEYAAIADVDNDNEAEIITVGNTTHTGYLHVIESATEISWPPARNIWNQRNYRITAINDDLTVPITEVAPHAEYPIGTGQHALNVFEKQLSSQYATIPVGASSCNALALAIAANSLDTDGDGITDKIDIDDDNDGILDTLECNAAYVANPTPEQPNLCDWDGDGISNELDLDADGDGIPDNVEAQATAGYLAPLGSDSDNDGLDDAYDTDNGGTQLTPVDTDGAATDGDGTQTLPDFLDTNADDEGANDAVESGNIDAGESYADPNGSLDIGASQLPNSDGSFETVAIPDFRDAVVSCTWDEKRGWAAGKWQLGLGGNGVARYAVYEHPLGTISAQLSSGMPTGTLWNYHENGHHQYKTLFGHADWSIESESILGIVDTNSNNGTVITLDMTSFPQEQSLAIGLENMGTYETNAFRYQMLLLDAEGNSIGTDNLRLLGTEKSPNTGGNIYGRYDEEVSVDSNGVIETTVVGANSLNSKAIFWMDIPANVATVQLNIINAAASFHDFFRFYLGTPDYCPTDEEIAAASATSTGTDTGTSTDTTTDSIGTTTETSTSGTSTGGTSTDGGTTTESTTESTSTTFGIAQIVMNDHYQVNEGETLVTVLQAENSAADATLVWQISGGADASLFTLNQGGALSFQQAPDFESPVDLAGTDQVAGDNVYVVDVTLQDTQNSLESTRSLQITVVDVAPVSFSSKVLLRGAYVAADQLMRDDLRAQGLIPLQQPFAAAPFAHNETVTVDSALLDISGELALVDWVLVDFRRPNDWYVPVMTRALMVQRNGVVVDPTTGADSIALELPAGHYYVSLRHRNHLGVISAQPLYFAPGATTSADFTSGNLAVKGDNARYLQQSQQRYLLWAGDANQDQTIRLNGIGKDQELMLGTIILDASNTNREVTHQTAGYLASDLNMDGVVVFDGSANDDSLLLYGTTTDHPGNTVFTDNYSLSGGMADY